MRHAHKQDTDERMCPRKAYTSFMSVNGYIPVRLDMGVSLAKVWDPKLRSGIRVKELTSTTEDGGKSVSVLASL